MTENEGEDLLLGGRVRLQQPDNGYRAAIDPVLLAAFTAAAAAERVLDLGTGAGAAALCLAARLPMVRVLGLEREPAMAALARRNAERNGMGARVLVVEGDLLRPPPALGPASFDRVMMNPPYLRAEGAVAPPDPLKAAANVEGEAKLADWIAAAGRLLKSRGILTLVHRADRLDEILALLHRQFGGVVVFPVWPHAGEPARRVLIAAVRSGKAPAVLAPGLLLHEADGTYTPAAESVLRDAAALAP